MVPRSSRLVIAVVVGFSLVVAGYGSTSLAHQWNQECKEQWGDAPEPYADCEDFLHVAMFYGGAGVGTLGVALLGVAGRAHWSRSAG